MLLPPVYLYNAVAVSSTTTYKSVVMIPDERWSHITVASTSTAAGDLESEVNDMTDEEYSAAVTAAGSEAANTTGWVKESMLQNGSAFIAGTPATAVGKLAMAAANAGTINIGPGPRRRRLTYTNGSGSGALTARLQYRRSN
jgi:hypothetical protein